MASIAGVPSHTRLALSSHSSSVSSAPLFCTHKWGEIVPFSRGRLGRLGFRVTHLRSGLPRCRPTNCSANKNPTAGDEGTGFCIIEGPETVQDFVQLQLQDIQENIRSRRNKIFLLMEEVRRLRIQQRIKLAGPMDGDSEEENEMPEIASSIPFLPDMTLSTRRKLYLMCFSIISGIIFFGGFFAPILELKLGLGGTSYADFIRSLHLPQQLSQVDPIVASFSGGAVGVISALMVIEINNVEQQEKKRCKYCLGTGYLACARCSGRGTSLSSETKDVNSNSSYPLIAPKTQRCVNCSGTRKVMCTACLCTGLAMASEHDPRIDPFD